ncbi:MAG: DUF4405 domain-containing protein [Vicinamibacterales bacterium]
MKLTLEPFRIRSFVTLVLLWSFAMTAVSGLVLFLRPEGSLARWVGWTVLGLDKKQWEAIHISFIVALMAASAVHIWYNRRPLLACVKRRVPARQSWAVLPAREFLAATALIAFMWCGTLVEWQPFSSIVDLRTAMKDGEMLAAVPPPLPEAEKLPVAEICRRLAIPEAQALLNAQSRGIVIADPSATIEAVAAKNHVSPENVYLALRGDEANRRVTP